MFMSMMWSMDVHVGRKLAQCLVEVVHLGQDTDHGDNDEDVSRSIAKLVMAVKRQLQGNAECLDSHDRDGPDGGADAQVDERVLLAVDRANLVNHDSRKYADAERVDQEPCVIKVNTAPSEAMVRVG